MGEAILDVAKRTLGISPAMPWSYTIPNGYMAELAGFLTHFPDDTHFRLYPQPRRGYGIIKCLENGCERISLTLNPRAGVDNGLEEGIGSLCAYRIHAQTDHTHRRGRRTRVEAKAKGPSNVTNSVLSSPRPVVSLSMRVKSQSSKPSSSPSTSSPLIPLKRYSMDSDTDITVPDSSSSATSKKAKFDMSKFNTPSMTPEGKIQRTQMSRSNFHRSWESAFNKYQIATDDQRFLMDMKSRARHGAILQHIGNTPAVPTALSLPPEFPNYGDTAGYNSDDANEMENNYLINRRPIVAPDDIDRFLHEAGNSELFDGNESIDKALEKLGLEKLGKHLLSMNVALMPHQVLGVAWMVEHERGPHKGGILADEMGLGKTVQMIATIVKHRSDDPAVKSTLICAPLALLEQWKLEAGLDVDESIETKTDGSLNCLIYHGSRKPKSLRDLQKYDIVITTFQTMALECPEDKKQHKKKSKDDFIEDDSQAEKWENKKGLLLRMKWFRVVLDEAQNVRNRNTRVSNAVTVLNTRYRWCLTGTPIINSLADCYGLIRFLKIRPWYGVYVHFLPPHKLNTFYLDWSEFNVHIAILERRQPDVASRRLQAILNLCLLRRKKDSVLDGKKLIELPLKDVILRKLTFSQEERDIYNVVEQRSQGIFNKFHKAGTVLKNYSYVLVLLLRLRQLCSHPCLIQEGGDAFIRPGDGHAVKHEVQTELSRAVVLAGQKFVDDTKAKLKDIALRRMFEEKASADASVEEEDCPICFDAITTAVITRCGHSFCAGCINIVMQQPPVEDGNEPRYAMSQRPCPVCRTPVEKEMIFQRSVFEPTDAELSEDITTPIIIDVDEDDGMPIDSEVLPTKMLQYPTPIGKVKRKYKQRSSKKLVQSDNDGMSDFIVETDEDKEEQNTRRNLKRQLARNRKIVLDSDGDGSSDQEAELLPPKTDRNKKGKNVECFLPSTKMKEMMVLLKEWAAAEETKNEKWTSCLDLIADYLDEHGFTFVRYQGDMSRQARDTAVKLFMSRGKARIMLMSLKCGGVGLNLTRANRVISIDLGWSFAVENQAFDRVHRLGQTRSVTVQRLVIEDTVESRILALQERKQNLADGSLGEGTGKKLGKLSIKDLANLFGLSARG
ncbi:SNF2 family N-terminal domain-containing protein [Hysterangium stoloniferum]|nr:SNF2 family N-terminal domain-containing protein [Hysterangium stoloniferum]